MTERSEQVKAGNTTPPAIGSPLGVPLRARLADDKAHGAQWRVYCGKFCSWRPFRPFLVCLVAFSASSGKDRPANETAFPPALASAVAEFNRAYRDWDRTAMETVAERFNALAKENPDSFEEGYWHCVARLHALLHRRGTGGTPGIDQVDAVREVIETLLQRHPGQGELHAMLGTLYGLRISARRLGAVRDGPRFQRHFRTALQKAPDNPRVHYLMGRALLHGPSMLGGPERALEHFQRAVIGFESELGAVPGPILPSWGHSHTLSGIGWIHLRAGDAGQAEAAFRDALRLSSGETEAREGLKRIHELKQ